MNKYYVMILVLFTGAQSTLGQLYLSTPVEVSGLGEGTRAPRIALVENDRPVVYWGRQGSSPKLYLAVWDNGKFNESVQISTNGIDLDLWGGGLGPQIAAYKNKIFLVFESYGKGIYCIKSEDGGSTFLNPSTVFLAGSGRTATLPSLTIDENGNPIVSYITTNLQEQEARYEVSKSDDGGQTFLPSVTASTATDGTEVCECCPASLVASNGEVYLAFRNNDDNIRDIWIAQSTDNGESFTTATDVDTVDWFIQFCPTSGPDMIDANEELYTTFFNGGPNGINIYFSSLDKATMEVKQNFNIPSLGDNKNQNFPSIAGNKDTLGVIWQESGQSGFDIVMTWSIDGVENLVNNIIPVDQSDKSQSLPDIAYSNGKFHIVYEDLNSNRVVYRIASFEEPSSIQSDVFTSSNIMVYPNPMTDNVSIKGCKGSNVKLLNNLGQLLEHRLISSESETFKMYSYPAGTYLIMVNTKGKLESFKVLKL